jgi:hypothetical protein
MWKRVVFSAFMLSACSPPQPPAPPLPPTPDPLAVRYEVRVGQTALPNVRGVTVTGPDLEMIVAQPAGAPPRLLAGRIGAIKLEIATDWAASERGIETWRAWVAHRDIDEPFALTPQTVTIVLTSSGAPATYTFERCWPTEHRLQLAAQDTGAVETWGVACEGFVRS